MNTENLLRIFNNSWNNFRRNLWLSTATLAIMIAALTMIGGLVLFNASSGAFVSGIKDKVDVSVYFKREAAEADILAVQEDLQKLEQVRAVEYISRDRALEIFEERHQNNEVIMAALGELDDNPLQASLNIKVHDTEQFESVVDGLESSLSASLIDEINFRENEKVINRINSIAATVSTGGAAFTVALSAFVFLVTFNTVRLAIYTARDEIQIMKLVGASNWFVRAPFVITGAMYGAVAALVTLAFLFLFTWLLGTQVSVIFAEVNLFGYLISNLLMVSLTLFAIGIGFGALSSYFAVRRYLKV